MGLIKAGMGAVGGVLGDQWKEFIYCDSLAADVLVTKGQKRLSSEGRSSNTSGEANVISNGSVIAVNEGQAMIIVEQGKVVDLCAEPGEYIYDQSTEPSIRFLASILPSNALMSASALLRYTIPHTLAFMNLLTRSAIALSALNKSTLFTFFAIIILSIMLFVYYAMKEAAKKSVAEKFVYTVSFSQEFEGAEGRVFLDDSLLYSGSPVMPDSIITAQRYTTRSENSDGKVQQQVHFTESSVLRVEVAGVDTVEVVVGNRDAFFVMPVDGGIVLD